MITKEHFVNILLNHVKFELEVQKIEKFFNVQLFESNLCDSEARLFDSTMDSIFTEDQKDIIYDTIYSINSPFDDPQTPESKLISLIEDLYEEIFSETK